MSFPSSSWRVQLVSTMFVTAVLASHGTAATFYVNTNGGNDGNPGTSQSPLKTIQEAVDRATTGSNTIIVVGHGYAYTYDEKISIINKSNLTITKLGGGSTPVISGGGGTRDQGVFMQGCVNVDIEDIIITGARRFGLQLEGSQNCDFTNCSFLSSTSIGPGGDGSGVSLSGGATDNIKFTNCLATLNNRDGFYVNSTKKHLSSQSQATMSNIHFTNCTGTWNARQGLKTEGVHVLRISGGSYSDNQASGVQLEDLTIDAVLTNVTANDNGRNTHLPGSHAGEAGIWVNESTDVDVISCVTRRNPWNININQSDDVWVTTCTTTDAIDYGPYGGSGLIVGTGKHFYEVIGGTPDYPLQPMGGVRDLTIQNCTFAGNDNEDIWYRDNSGEDDNDAPIMVWTNNEKIGSPSATVLSEPFDLGNGTTGYLSGWLEDLDY